MITWHVLIVIGFVLWLVAGFAALAILAKKNRLGIGLLRFSVIVVVLLGPLAFPLSLWLPDREPEVREAPILGRPRRDVVYCHFLQYREGKRDMHLGNLYMEERRLRFREEWSQYRFDLLGIVVRLSPKKERYELSVPLESVCKAEILSRRDAPGGFFLRNRMVGRSKHLLRVTVIEGAGETDLFFWSHSARFVETVTRNLSGLPDEPLPTSPSVDGDGTPG